MKKLNLVGEKYGRLTVIAEAAPIAGQTRSRKAYKCRCDCGTVKVIKMDSLRGGSTKSCGCLNDEKRSERAHNMYLKCIKYSPQEASARYIWKKRYAEMPFEDFLQLSQQNCFYCGDAPSNSQNVATAKSSTNMKENGAFTYNGLDRRDNTLPHSKGNCVPCCKYCNYAKRERSLEEFANWLEKVYCHFINNNCLDNSRKEKQVDVTGIFIRKNEPKDEEYQQSLSLAKKI